jgi:hypothetical protein
MIRSPMVLAGAVVLTLAGSAAVAGAEPSPSPCSYRLSPPQVFYQPYRPGTIYIATGRGCANTGNPPQPVCQPLGPLTATL